MDRRGRTIGMMRISALMLALGSAAAAHAAPPHYDVAAKFDPQGVLDADVTIPLSEGEAEKAFLLSDRFALRPMDLPPGVPISVAIGRSAGRERVVQYVEL